MTETGAPATGNYDIQFKLFDSPDIGAGTQLGGTIANSALQVANGVFKVILDFGADVFNGQPRFIEIGVRPSGSSSPHQLLAPRQPITPTPYALHSFSATIASNIAPGAVVKSLNNLKDNVTLAAGANVMLTTNGNTLTIASTGGGSGGLWMSSGTNVYFTGGNAGVGTTDPRVRLEINGNTLFTPGGSGGVIQLGTPSFETGMSIVGANRADYRFDGSTLKLVANAGTGIPPAENGIAIGISGNVGVGTIDPQAKLDIGGNLRYEGTINKLDVSDSFTATVRAGDFKLGYFSRRGEPGRALVDSYPALHLNFEDWPTTVIGGNVGIGTTAPTSGKLQVDGGAGTAVYGKSSSGAAFAADGNATQNSDKGGFVKAMLYVSKEGNITRCYNGVFLSSTGNCGFEVVAIQAGVYRVTFPFPVATRFVSVTAEYASNRDFGDIVNNRGVNFRFLPANDRVIDVFTFRADEPDDTNSSAFMLIVF